MLPKRIITPWDFLSCFCCRHSVISQIVKTTVFCENKRAVKLRRNGKGYGAKKFERMFLKSVE